MEEGRKGGREEGKEGETDEWKNAGIRHTPTTFFRFFFRELIYPLEFPVNIIIVR